MIIGVGCVAMLQLLGSGTMANNESTELTTAMNLAGNVREAMTGLAYAERTNPTHWGREAGEADVTAFDDLDDFDGWTSAPGTPVDARLERLGAEFQRWVQQVKVESVRPDNLTQTMSHLTLHPSERPTCRVTVKVLHNGTEVYEQSWVAAYADPSAPTTQPSSP